MIRLVSLEQYARRVVGLLNQYAPQLLSLVGVVLVGVGVGLHDLGAGLSVAGVLVIGLVVFSILLPRILKDC